MNEIEHVKAFALGVGLKSTRRDQVIVGHYNGIAETNADFIIGVGTEKARKTLAYATSSNFFVNGSPVVTEAGCNKLSVGDKNTNEKNYTLTVGNNNVNSSENGVVFGKQNSNKNFN